MRFYPWNIWEWGFSFNEGDTFVMYIYICTNPNASCNYRISLCFDFRHFVDHCVSFALYFVPYFGELVDQTVSSLFSRTIDPRCDSSFYEIYVYICVCILLFVS